jgi:hypothetical protein
MDVVVVEVSGSGVSDGLLAWFFTRRIAMFLIELSRALYRTRADKHAQNSAYHRLENERM